MKNVPPPVPDSNALPSTRGASIQLEPRFPGLDDLDRARKWVDSTPRPWAVDLFSGAGGLSLGLERAGLHIIAAADSDRYALATHNANVGGLSWSQSLASPGPFLEFLAERGVRHVDVVAGGPPCQPFSRAAGAKIRSLVNEGKRAVVDERVDLWNSYRDVLAALNPRIALLENVPDLIAWEEGQTLQAVLSMFRDLGYVPEVRVLRGEDFAVPQHRSRLFIVARTGGSFTWPKRRTRVTLRDAIGDLPAVDPGHRDDSSSYGEPQTPFQRRARAAVAKSDRGIVRDHCTRDVRKDDAEAFALLGQGQTYADLPARYQRYRTDVFDDKYKRLAWDDVSRSITAHIAKDGYWYIHPEQDRTLSIREAARVQTFPDHIRFTGPPTQQFRQIGNAVPPALGYAIGRRLVACLADEWTEASEPKVAVPLVEWDAATPTRSPLRDWPYLAALVCTGPADRALRWELERALETDFDTPERVQRGTGDLTSMMRRLGLENRMVRLQELAAALVKTHSGGVPDNQKELRALPHVSGLMADMVCSEVLGLPVIVLDAPRQRAVQRLAGRTIVGLWDLRLETLRLAADEGPSPRFNRALRTLGTDVCHPTRPACEDCPAVDHCASVPTGGESAARV